MNYELLEPCCYTKQFNAALSSSSADVINLFHSGDVDVVRFLDRVAAYSVADSTLWLVLPFIAPYTVESLQQILSYTRYVDGQYRLCFPVVNILTREVTPELKALTSRPGQTITIATDKQLGMRIIGFTSQSTAPSSSAAGSTTTSPSTAPSSSADATTPTSPSTPSPEASNRFPLKGDGRGSLFISGSLIQSIQFGAHMVTIHRGQEQADMITPYLSRQIRFHKSLEITNQPHTT